MTKQKKSTISKKCASRARPGSLPNLTVILPDIHIPVDDPAAVEWALWVVREINPSKVILLGDVLDLDALSRFQKTLRRQAGLLEELDVVRDWIAEVAAEWAEREVVYLYGNHEVRLESYLLRNAPELAELPELSLRALLRIPASWTTVPYKHAYMEQGVLVEHGVRFAHGLCQSNLNRLGMSSVCGHSHRAALAHRRMPDGRVITAVESGCLSQVSMGYAPLTDWVAAVTVIDEGQVELVRR